MGGEFFLGRASALVACALAAGIAVFFTGCVNPRKFAVRPVSPGIFAGQRPMTDGQFERLKAQGVRTILSLQVCPWDTWPERRMAREHGFKFVNLPIVASPFPPSEKRIQAVLATLTNPRLQPIYFHCRVGVDRTMTIWGLYRVYYEDWCAEAAWEEMAHNGFVPHWYMGGFSQYFWSHTDKPEWAKRAAPAPTEPAVRQFVEGEPHATDAP